MATVSILLCVIHQLIILSSSLNTGWIDYTFSSGIYCSSTNGICSHIAHFVFWIEPINPLLNYIGGGYISFDNNTSWQSASKIEFEQHYFSFNDTLRVQVYNYMYETFFTLDMIQSYNVSTMNVKLFINDIANNNNNIQYLQLPYSLELNQVNLNIPPNTEEASFYDHGNSTIECNVKLNQCRLVVHVVFKYAAKGDFIDNYNYIGNGELYINNDTMPTNLTGNMNVVWEKAMVFQNNTWYHGSNWGFDYIGDYEFLSKSVKVLCWKVFVMDLQGTNIHYIPMDGGYGGYQVSKYVRCFNPIVHFWT